ncbi:MAG: MmcQ/YjbR family DNA-binding protein [Clostridiales bacterium]|nr:MmcQ/YjbR family DNA-binding protein [Clostridiales bacterium]
MTKEELFKHIKATYDVEPDYPWMDENAVVRHKDTRKWFGLVMNITADKLGIKSSDRIDVLNVKCDPILIGSLVQEKGYYFAYHMNKNSWISIDINQVKDDNLKMLLDMSYELTSKK